MNKPLIPVEFVIPEKLETDRFRLRILTVNDVVKDYDAVMTSIDHLQGVFGEGSKWPSYDLTLEQDLIDLGWHQKEFQRRSSFAYTVMALDESQCLGCMYIFPSGEDGYEVDIYCWVRKSELGKGLDEVLFSAIEEWIAKEWPFQKVRFPGRS